MSDLLIVNMYGTIVPEDGGPILRRDFNKFLERYGKNIVISAYMPRQKAEADLDSVGLLGKVKLYSLEDMNKFFTPDDVPEEYDTTHKRAKYAAECVTGERMPDKYHAVPNFRNIVREAGIGLNDAIVISNDPEDVYEACCQRMRTMQVPTFDSGPGDGFSFGGLYPNSLKYEIVFRLQKFVGKPEKIVL